MISISFTTAVGISGIMGVFIWGLMMWSYMQGRRDQAASVMGGEGETEGQWEGRMDSACDYCEDKLGRVKDDEKGQQWAHQTLHKSVISGVWLTEGVYDSREEALDAHLGCYLENGGLVETRVVPLAEVMWVEG